MEVSKDPEVTMCRFGSSGDCRCLARNIHQLLLESRKEVVLPVTRTLEAGVMSHIEGRRKPLECLC
jgi:hypothetical protein